MTSKPTVILASGEYPSHPVPLRMLAEAERVICCDGAANTLCASGRIPDFIIGDLDSLSPDLRALHADRVIHEPSQESNDLSKAFDFCIRHDWRDLLILGAGGGREDHLLGNIALLADFAEKANVAMATNHGLIRAFIASPAYLQSQPGQQISLFACDPETCVSGTGFKYPLDNLQLRRWWTAALNEATHHALEIRFTRGPIIVWQSWDAVL